MSNRQQYEQYYWSMMAFAYAILFLNLYFFCHPFFAELGWSHESIRAVLIDLRNGGALDVPWKTKGIVYLLIFMSHITRTGVGKDVKWGIIIALNIIGPLLFFIRPSSMIMYAITTCVGLLISSWGIALIARKLTGFNQDVNDDNETFEQCTELVETEDSINIPMKFQYKKKIRKGWINVVNPFRATMILGTPGSGKSFSVYNPFIAQMIKKGYAMFVYDYKFPDLTEVVYNEALRRYPPIRNPRYFADRSQPEYIPDPSAPTFYVINFKDPRYSNRCNPIHARYLSDPADSAEVAEIIMKNVAPNSVEKEDFFSMSAKVYLDAIIWYLKIYKGGIYCSFPHVIELMAQDYKKVFAIMSTYPELETKIKPFKTALEAGAQDQLQGQIASAQIPLNKMASPSLYWVLSGDDFTLDINDPEHPKILCVGNDPDRQSIYGTTLALFTSRMFKLINHKGKRKCGVLLDELPTIFIKGLDTIIATARSNKVAVVAGAQDKSQLIRDYTEKEANVIFNTVGNYFSGQVNGRTAEDLNKSFGREKRLQESQTMNIDSESLQKSFHDEELMPIRKIETLTQGYFFGKVADNNSTPIAKKLFCGEIQIDPSRFPGKATEKLPVMTDFGEDEIRMLVNQPHMKKRLIREHCVKNLERSGYEGDMDEAIENMAESLSDAEIKKIIDAAQEEMLNNKVARLVEENFLKIRQDVENIIKDEMGDDDESDEDTESDSPFDDLFGDEYEDDE